MWRFSKYVSASLTRQLIESSSRRGLPKVGWGLKALSKCPVDPCLGHPTPLWKQALGPGYLLAWTEAQGELEPSFDIWLLGK